MVLDILADISTRGFQLPYVVMDSLFGVQQTIFPESDEGVNGPFPLDIGFPFGSSNQEQVYVSQRTRVCI